MRICLIASNRYPICEPFHGGLESHTAALARGLRARGHTVAMFAEAHERTASRQMLPPQGFEPSAAARSDVSAAPLEWMRDHHAYLGLMHRLATVDARHFDLVHNNSLHYLPVAMASLLSVPVVTTLHTPPTPWLESALAYSGSTASFCAVSRHTAEAWSHVTTSVVIRNGVDTRRWSFGPGGTRAVWVGRIVVEKAPHLAIAAARRAGRPLVLAGPIHDRGYFATRIAPELDEDVRYLGHLTSEALIDVVGASAVAVLTPDWDEPYGLVAAEAMACGTPVAAFARGGVSEIVPTSVGRLVSPGDVAGLARAIEEAAHVERGAVRRHAVRHLSDERMLDDYESWYRRARRQPGAA